MTASRAKLLKINDISRLGTIVLGGTAATLWPRRFDQAALKTLLRIRPDTQPEKTAQLAALMESALSARRHGDWDLLAREHALMTVENAWGRFRAYSPRGWHPSIEFIGEERVREALKAGRGAVFWFMRFCSELVFQQGFYRAGLPLVHLSSALHGTNAGRTMLGMKIISPLYRRAEDPYLAARVIIPLGESVGYIQTLRDHLRANQCVSMFGDSTGRSPVEVPFLTGHAKFAVGAPSIAWTEDSALFPVHVVRTGSFQYRVVVDEPIPVDRSLPRKQFVPLAVADFAQRLERLVIEHPSNWQDWNLWKDAQG